MEPCRSAVPCSEARPTPSGRTSRGRSTTWGHPEEPGPAGGGHGGGAEAVGLRALSEARPRPSGRTSPLSINKPGLGLGDWAGRRRLSRHDGGDGLYREMAEARPSPSAGPRDVAPTTWGSGLGTWAGWRSPGGDGGGRVDPPCPVGGRPGAFRRTRDVAQQPGAHTERSGRLEEARKHFEEALRIRQDRTMQHYGLAAAQPGRAARAGVAHCGGP